VGRMKELDHEEEFYKFHLENPGVLDQLVELALQLKKTGRKHYAIQALYEVLRYHRAISTSDSQYKLNNNHTAYYARKIMADVPQLAGFFTIRNSEHLNGSFRNRHACKVKCGVRYLRRLREQ